MDAVGSMNSAVLLISNGLLVWLVREDELSGIYLDKALDTGWSD